MSDRVVAVVSETATTLGEILPRLGEGAALALSEGRIFVGSRRAAALSDDVGGGVEVVMYPPRAEATESARILVQSEGIVAAYKPAALPTVADHRGVARTLVSEIEAMIGRGRGELVPTSRLDVGVSGVVVFAADAGARERLAEARAMGRYRRHYVAIASSSPSEPVGLWDAPIGRDRDPRRRRVLGRDHVPAATRYAEVSRLRSASLLAVEPQTGRTHQIRVHAAHAGCALLGDAVYGGPARIVLPGGTVRALGRIALHAAWVEIPTRDGKTQHIEAAIPDDLVGMWSDLGGLPSDWDEATKPLT